MVSEEPKTSGKAQMADEIKVPVESPSKTPDTKAPVDVPFIDNTRKDIEAEVTLANNTFPEIKQEDTDSVETPEETVKAEEVKTVEPELTPFDKMKKSVQKRIDKEVAKRKTMEEQLADAQAEIDRLKNSKDKSDTKPEEKRDPTDAEIKLALKKAREDGDIEFETQIVEYMIERKANKIADERVSKIEEAQKSKQAQSAKELDDWTNLTKDYLVYDEGGKVNMSHELNLANQQGLLYKTALKLYQDKELHSEFYGDPDRIQGFRRAVADAYRGIHQQNLLDPTKNEKIDLTPVRRKVTQLAEPYSEVEQDTTQVNSPILTDADKVSAEIKQRRKYQNARMSS